MKLLVILFQFKQQEFGVKLPSGLSLIPRKSSNVRLWDISRIQQLLLPIGNKHNTTEIPPVPLDQRLRKQFRHRTTGLRYLYRDGSYSTGPKDL